MIDGKRKVCRPPVLRHGGTRMNKQIFPRPGPTHRILKADRILKEQQGRMAKSKSFRAVAEMVHLNHLMDSVWE